MIDLLTDAAACYRLTRLAVTDTLLDVPRGRLLERLEQSGPTGRKIAEGLGCPWCVGMWMAGAVVLAAGAAPRVWRPIARALTLSTVAGLLSEHSG